MDQQRDGRDGRGGRKPVLAGVAGAISAGLAVMCLVIAGGMHPGNSEWIPAWLALGGLYGVSAFGLFLARSWARWYTVGLGLWGLVCFVESYVVVAYFPLAAAGIAIHAGLLAALVAMPGLPGEPRDRRLAFSMVAASAAVPCAAIFGLAPQHTLAVSACVLGGAIAVAAGAWGVCRGRTWGLLVGICAALLVAAAVTRARHAGWLHHPHPLLPNSNPLALLGLGVAAAVLSLAATVPFWRPMVRMLRGR